MGRFYPVEWLCSFVAKLRAAGLRNEAAWFNQLYIQPNVHSTLFEVTDYKPWLAHLRKTILVLEAKHKPHFDSLVQENSNVTYDVLKTAHHASSKGNCDDYARIFNPDDRAINYTAIFRQLNYAHVYDTYADLKNPIQWLVEVEYPRFIAWQVFCPEAAAGVTFDNYVVIQKYLRDDVNDLVTRNQVIIDKVCRKDTANECLVFNSKPGDITAVVEKDGNVQVSSRSSIETVRHSGWSDTETLVCE